MLVAIAWPKIETRYGHWQHDSLKNNTAAYTPRIYDSDLYKRPQGAGKFLHDSTSRALIAWENWYRTNIEMQTFIRNG